jgi:hypothetical protein
MTASTTREIAPSEIRGLIELETDADRLRTLRRDWRIAALKQWVRGPRILALLAAMAIVPVMAYLIESAPGILGPLGGLGNMVQPLVIALLVPTITVVFTLLALDGPCGIARLNDLRTIEGGPAEWTRALLMSARVCVVAVLAVWVGALAIFTDEVGALADDVFPLANVLLFLWTIPSVVGVCRLRISIPVLGSMVLWGVSMWPGLMISLGELGTANSRCGTGLNDFMSWISFGHLLQGIIAWSNLNIALDGLANTPE